MSTLVAIMMVSAMGAVAIGSDDEATPMLVPTEPELGPNGPRLVQPWTGTALNVLDGWSVEVLEPAPDLEAAGPGEAWEALRLTSPLGQRTCSLYVALADDDQPSLERVWAHLKPRPIAEPRWDFRGDRPALLYPDPAERLAAAEAWTYDDWDATTRSCSPGISREALQVWACASEVDSEEPQELSPYSIARVFTPELSPGEIWGTTVPAGRMLQPRMGFTATLLPDGRVLVVGGRFGKSLTSAEVWDPASRTFGPAGEMKHRRTGHTAVLQPDGGVLIVGGTGRYGANTKNAELWDPVTATFRPAGVLHTPRTTTATVTGFPDGRALVVGGNRISGETGPVLRAELWDPESARFERAGALDGPRVGHRTFALPGGHAMVTGPGSKEWLRWDAGKRAFQAVGQTDEPRSETYQLGDGRLLAVGVTDQRTCKKGKAYASTPDAEVWLPRRGVFRSGGAFKSPRYEATVTPLPSGGALFYGGGIATCMDVARYPSAELWDPDTRTFRRVGRTALPHWDEATALLPDGRVAVIGGIGTRNYSCPDAVLGSIELWDPSTRSFSVAGALAEPRSSSTAIPLSDGSVLILGGVDRLGDPVALAELWVPPPTR
jgi:hypothetical protein